jgi:hypothetical protein
LSGLADGIGKNVGVGCSSLNNEKICFGVNVFVGIGARGVEVAEKVGEILSVGSGVTTDAQETRKIDTKGKRIFLSLINVCKGQPNGKAQAQRRGRQDTFA